MDVHIEHHGRVTEAEVSHFGFTGHGSALRSKNDVNLDEIGGTIATGRAMQDLGRQIEMSGHVQCVTKEEYGRVMSLINRRLDRLLSTLGEMEQPKKKGKKR